MPTIDDVRLSHFDHDKQTMVTWATITNDTASTLPSGRLTVANSGFRPDARGVEVPTISPFGSTKVNLTMHAKQGGIRSADHISNDTRYEYKAGGFRATQSIGGNYTMLFYTDKFCKKPDLALGVKRFNVMLFGLYGSGKSSFLNTVMTLVSKDAHIVTNAAIVGGGEEHTTTSLRQTKIPDDDNAGMAIWDTWGVSHGAGGGQAETYKSGELDLILNGLLANKWDMSKCERIVDFQQDIRRAVASAPQRRQHAVVFMFPYTLFGDEGLVDPRIHDAKRYLRKFFDMHIQPLILITQADIACPQLRANPMGTYPQTERMRQIAAKQIGVPLGHVYLMVNYVQETERSFNIDRNTYRILEAIQNRAVQHVRCRLPAPLPTHLHQPLSQRPSPGWPPCGYGTAPARWLAGWP